LRAGRIFYMTFTCRTCGPNHYAATLSGSASAGGTYRVDNIGISDNRFEVIKEFTIQYRRFAVLLWLTPDGLPSLTGPVLDIELPNQPPQ
jgi:hypothetical protein